MLFSAYCRRSQARTEAVPRCSAEAKDTFGLIFLSREILELWGLVNGSDFAIPCLVRLLVITHALSYIHNMEDIRLKRWQPRKYVFLSNKEMFVVSHGQSVVLRQMSVWWYTLAPILQYMIFLCLLLPEAGPIKH